MPWRRSKLLPSPLWGGVGGGGREFAAQLRHNLPTPHPDPPPQGGRETRLWSWPRPDPPRRRRGRAVAIVATIAGGISWVQADATMQPYVVVGDAIPASLTGVPGDPVRGKAIVVSRQTGLCLLCHSAPLPEEKFQGTIGPDLKGVGLRNTEGQLRLRIVDSRIFNPDTIMPSYYRLDGLEQVAPAFRGKTVLTAEQIEDVVAFLMTLRD